MQTPVRVLRGRWRGRQGWISGTLADRGVRGATKAIVHLPEDVELLEVANLEAIEAQQIDMFDEARSSLL